MSRLRRALWSLVGLRLGFRRLAPVRPVLAVFRLLAVTTPLTLLHLDPTVFR